MSYLEIRKKLNKYIKLQPGGTLEYLKPQTMGLSITPDSSGLANLGADGSVSVNQDVLDEQLDQVADNIEASDAKSNRGLLSGQKARAAAGIAAGVASDVIGVVDNALTGDKNFGAQSTAIDTGVHAASSALMKSGNPYAMIAGAALEGVNFLTKAGGQTVQGFDVNIDNSGYGNLGHMESSSSRDFGAMIGLGGLNQAKMDKKLARRNEQARMALKAAAISEDQSFEKEARTNSIDNVLRTNQMALAGGVNLSLI